MSGFMQSGFKAQLAGGSVSPMAKPVSSLPGGIYSGNDTKMLMNKISGGFGSRNMSMASPNVQAMNSYKQNFTPSHAAVKLAPLSMLENRSSSVPRMHLPDQGVSRSHNITDRRSSVPQNNAMPAIQENKQMSAIEFVQMSAKIRLQKKTDGMMKRGINSTYSRSYKDSGMHVDNSLYKQQIKDITDKRAKERIIQKGIIAKKRTQLRHMMQDEYMFDDQYVARQHFRDELNLLQQIKERHVELRSVQASIFIQKMWRGISIRRTIGVVVKEKIAAAQMVSRIWRSKKRIETFRSLARDYKNFMAVKVQRYMKGLLGWRDGALRKKVKAMSDLDGWLQVKREAMLIDAQIKIAYTWRKYVKVLAVRQAKAKKEAKRKKAQDAADKIKKQKAGITGAKGATIKGAKKKKTAAAADQTLTSVKDSLGQSKMQMTGQISDMDMSITNQSGEDMKNTGFQQVQTVPRSSAKDELLSPIKAQPSALAGKRQAGSSMVVVQNQASESGIASPDKNYNDSIGEEIPQENDATFLTSPPQGISGLSKPVTQSQNSEKQRTESPVIGFNKDEQTEEQIALKDKMEQFYELAEGDMAKVQESIGEEETPTNQQPSRNGTAQSSDGPQLSRMAQIQVNRSMAGSIDMQNSIAEVDSEDNDRGHTFDPMEAGVEGEMDPQFAEGNDINAKLDSEQVEAAEPEEGEGEGEDEEQEQDQHSEQKVPETPADFDRDDESPVKLPTMDFIDQE